MQYLSEGVKKTITAIEIAVENNQIVALTNIIDFVVKYQNSYAFSYLFENHLLSLL
jgi:hypothetical protein